MSSFIYPADSRIVDGLMKGIEQLYAPVAMDTSPGSLSQAPPTIEQLKELLSCSFAASLETEEGRIITFTVSFFANKDQHFTYRMKDPFLLTPQNVARLAVALDPSRSRICVMPAESALTIAGIVHLGEQHPFFRVWQTLNQLSIRVLGPGMLVVRYRDQLLLTYRRGKFALLVGESPKLGEYNAPRTLSFRLPLGGSVEKLQADLRFEAALRIIARAMLAQRHGGTLLVIPEGADWEAAAPSKRYFPLAPVTSVRDAQRQNLTFRDQRNDALNRVVGGQSRPGDIACLSDYFTPARFVSELEWLGRLTATDGMTVISPDLTLLGFGVFFDTKEPGDNVTRVVVDDPYDDRPPEPKALASIGGARHQSAALTCRRFPGATAIVASQDGSLSSMTWDAHVNVVVVVQGLELLLDN